MAESSSPAESDSPANAEPPPLRRDGLPARAPDFVEQDFPEELDNIIPTHGYQMLPLVGLGGSAGSISALKAFFAAMPGDAGVAFVVILHLSPEFDSNLAAILARETKMRVVQAEHGQKVERNTVYVIPPGQILSAADGHLALSPAIIEFGKRVAVDLFFRSLADTHGPHAAAIVLSGADGDGALGIKRIKERGGLTVAQDPSEAEYPSMPLTAIETGMVDWILEVARIPERIINYYASEPHLQLPLEEKPAGEALPSQKENERRLREVVAYLRTRTGHDFSYYKRSTVVRRVSRRMQVNSSLTMQQYLDFLRTHAGEPVALLQDLLISVTNFFRDREAFQALEERVPQLFAGKRAQDVIRVWVPACATGEEAYSIAILLLEQAGKLEAPPAIQIFASDLDVAAITTAREALYPFSSVADISEERLQRFFTKEHRGYRVKRELRECVLFAEHDLLKDAPFSRLDLISCRNLLIYLTREAQKRALDTFHFGLRPKGLLFLGSTETITEESLPFLPLSLQHRLHEQVPTSPGSVLIPVGPSSFTRLAEMRRLDHGPITHGKGFHRSPVVLGESALDSLRAQGRITWEELHFALAAPFAPASLIIDQQQQIVHVSEKAARFLRFSPGEPTAELMQAVHPSLRVGLRACLFRATQTGTVAQAGPLLVDLEGQTKAVDLYVKPGGEQAPNYLLVLFSVREEVSETTGDSPLTSEPAVLHLESELDLMKVQMRDTVEQYEASTEELRAGNEELQAMNEELRSATEELETSREEMQSINEELTTVNHELKSKVDELGRANSDLANLMAATAVATIFLDRLFRITRYTPAAVTLFRLIPTDLGRPLTDLTNKLRYPNLKEDAEQVLRTLVSVQREVPDDEGRWFHAHLLPYRTTDNVIAGVVATFVDITNRRVGEETLRLISEERDRQLHRFDLIMSSAQDAIYHFDLEGRFTYANEPLLGLWKLSLEKALGKNYHDLHYPRALAERLQRQIQEVIRTGQALRDRMPFTNGEGTREFEYIFTPLLSPAGAVAAVAGVSRDITEQTAASAALRVSEERLRLTLENLREHAIVSLDLNRTITSWNVGAQLVLGWTEAEAVGQSADIIFTLEDRQLHAPEREAEVALREGRAADERWHQRKDGSRFWGIGLMMAMHDLEGRGIGLVKIFRDESAQREVHEEREQNRLQLVAALQETEQARAEAEAAGRAKDHFLAVLSHELRTPLTPVLMGVRTLRRKRDLTEDELEILTMIQRNVQVEAHFIDDLLDLTRINRGQLEIVREPMDLHDALHHAQEISQADLDAKEQRVTLQLEATHHALEGDPARLQQVFWNLLKNASKFSPTGSEITVRSRDVPVAGGVPARIAISIADRGIGFEEGAAQRIFEAFTQANEAITREFGGLGLGLAISKATIDAHGGTLRAESAGRAQGATFTVELPLSWPTESGC